MECQPHRAAPSLKLCRSSCHMAAISLSHTLLGIINSSNFIYNLYEAVKMRTRCLGMWVYIRLCNCDFAFFVSNVCFFSPLSPSHFPSRLLLPVNQFADGPTFRTNCIYLSPGVGVVNWIRGSITMVVFDKRTQSEWEAERGNCHKNCWGWLNKRAIKHSSLVAAGEGLN